MSYYTALITEWNAVTTANPSWTTAQKLNYINTLTITGTTPTSFSVTGNQLANCINWTEFAALNAAQQSNILTLINGSGSFLAGSAKASLLPTGMFLSYFSNVGPTITNILALAQATITPWYTANGYPGPFNNNDLIAAGGLS